MPWGGWRVSHIRYTKYLRLRTFRESWMLFKVISFPFLPYNSSRVCEGATPPKQPMAISSCPRVITPHPGCKPQSCWHSLNPVSLRCYLPHQTLRSLAGALGLGVHTHVVLGDTSGIKGVGTAWVIILTVSIINLALRQGPLGTYQSFKHSINLFVIEKSHSEGAKTPLFIPRLTAGTRKLEWQDSPWIFLFLSVS